MRRRRCPWRSAGASASRPRLIGLMIGVAWLFELMIVRAYTRVRPLYLGQGLARAFLSLLPIHPKHVAQVHALHELQPHRHAAATATANDAASDGSRFCGSFCGCLCGRASGSAGAIACCAGKQELGAELECVGDELPLAVPALVPVPRVPLLPLLGPPCPRVCTHAHHYSGMWYAWACVCRCHAFRPPPILRTAMPTLHYSHHTHTHT